MSTSPRSDWRPETADDQVELPPDLATHLHAAVTAAPSLDCVGFFEHDDFVYGLNRLVADPTAAPGTDRWDSLRRLGVQLAVAWRDLDRGLQPMRTGRLIRTVVDAEGGAVFCETVRPGMHVIGAVSAVSVDDREAADAAIASVVEHLRSAEKLPSQNHGSFADSGPPVAEAGSGEVLRASGDSSLVDSLSTSIRLDGLHALAFFARGEKLADVDCFDSPGLASFHELATPAERRPLYSGLGQELAGLASQLNQATSGALGGRLRRIVLDVQSGAVYYRRLPRQRYLVGVTLDQTRVGRADHQMTDLADHLSAVA
ncbi:hypothetical protein [Actinokineospora inagensis]|uniref:hypothetical protein n=1 Tax=Actinokineospora inagensis TaxID=103730 RepID=UPI00042A7263|nr:hypothetical protein [Actinokineospora inagensis]